MKSLSDKEVMFVVAADERELQSHDQSCPQRVECGGCDERKAELVSACQDAGVVERRHEEVYWERAQHASWEERISAESWLGYGQREVVAVGTGETGEGTQERCGTAGLLPLPGSRLVEYPRAEIVA